MSRHDPQLRHQTLLERLAAVEIGGPIHRALLDRSDFLAALDEAGVLLLAPTSPGSFTRVERHAIAAFVAVLRDEARTRAHALALLAETAPDLTELIEREAEGAAVAGPYGIWPPGPLSAEDLDGPAYRVEGAARRRLGPRLSAALEFAHLVTLHPRDAGPEALVALRKAGWTARDSAELGQLVGHVGTLAATVAGLRAWASAHQPALAWRSGTAQ